MAERKVKLYISMSLDGYLATKEDDLSWLSIVEKEGEDYGYAAFTKDIDTYLVGRRTYDTILKLTGGTFPQAEQYQCYVITRQDLAPKDGITFYTGSIEALIQQLKQEPGKHIYCDGGGQIVKLLLDKNLIDELIISIIPILLGDGKRLFLDGRPRTDLEFISSQHFDSGLVQVRYRRK